MRSKTGRFQLRAVEPACLRDLWETPHLRGEADARTTKTLNLSTPCGRWEVYDDQADAAELLVVMSWSRNLPSNDRSADSYLPLTQSAGPSALNLKIDSASCSWMIKGHPTEKD
jgi:hypothetical protein